MKGIEGEHAEYADDNCVWKNGEVLVEDIMKMNKDLKIGLKWCRMWNMLIVPEKTEVMIFTPGNEIVRPEGKNVEYDGEILKTKSAFSALRGIDEFVQGQRGCSQSVYMRLYKALVLPIMEYGTPVTVAAIVEGAKNLERYTDQLW